VSRSFVKAIRKKIKKCRESDTLLEIGIVLRRQKVVGVRAREAL